MNIVDGREKKGGREEEEERVSERGKQGKSANLPILNNVVRLLSSIVRPKNEGRERKEQ